MPERERLHHAVEPAGAGGRTCSPCWQRRGAKHRPCPLLRRLAARSGGQAADTRTTSRACSRASAAPTRRPHSQPLARLRVPRHRGRPRTRPEVALADEAYSSRTVREHLRERGIWAVIAVPADQRGHRLRPGSRGGRPPALNRRIYTQRNTVERCINRLKQWQGIATRYEKTPSIYLAGLHIAGIYLWSAR
ncbi:transposase [Streptomyces sp. VTCC 41912]|uniref:transposase n=1 Tax=Streptomyces sp. VTCC 41912 TaxID=3383243 RepID=UPI003896B29C